MGTYCVMVLNADRLDMTGDYVGRPPFDGNVPPFEPLGSFEGLDAPTATALACQLVDSMHEWGTVDPDPLYAEAKRIVDTAETLSPAVAAASKPRGDIPTPDGPTIVLVRIS